VDLLLDVLLLPKCKIDEALRLCHDVELLNKIQNVSQEVTESWDAGIPLYAKEALNEAKQAKIELLSLMLDEYNARMHKDVLERMQLAEGSLAAYDMLKDPGFIGKRYPRSKRKLSDKDIKELDELFHAQNRTARGKEYDERQVRIDELLGFIKPGKVKKAAAADLSSPAPFKYGNKAHRDRVAEIILDLAKAGSGVLWQDLGKAIKAEFTVANWLDVRSVVQFLKDSGQIKRTDNIHEERFVGAEVVASSYDEPYLFVVDLDERGYFKAHVEDMDGQSIFSFDNEIESEDDDGDTQVEYGDIWLIEDGYMASRYDMDGLRKYLVDSDVIPVDSVLFDRESSFLYHIEKMKREEQREKEQEELDAAEQVEASKDDVLSQIRSLSSGTMSTLTGFNKHSILDDVQNEWLLWETKYKHYETWQDSWIGWMKWLGVEMKNGKADKDDLYQHFSHDLEAGVDGDGEVTLLNRLKDGDRFKFAKEHKNPHEYVARGNNWYGSEEGGDGGPWHGDGNMRVIKLPAKAEAAMSNVNKIKRSLKDCQQLETEMVIRFENGMLTKSQFERAMADIEKKREPLFKQLAEEQAEAAVLAVRLDGHGRNFSKQEIKEMREELVEMGAYNNAEVDDMDDEDVLGYWQAEIGYIEMDDAACSYAETAHAAGAPDEYGLRWAEWGRSGSKVWKEKWFKKEADREKFFDKISEKDNFAEFGAYTDPESSADCTYAEIAAASEDIKTKVIILWRKGRSIRQIESELGVVIKVPGSISDMSKNVLSGNFDVHAESDLSYELKELEADEETGAAECGVYANNRIVAVLTQRVNDKGQKEWALVSHSKGKDGKRKVLKWFGKGKPSDKAVKKEEDRVQMFKHMR